MSEIGDPLPHWVLGGVLTIPLGTEFSETRMELSDFYLCGNKSKVRLQTWGKCSCRRGQGPPPPRVAAGPGMSGCSPSAQRGVHTAVSRVGRCQEWSEGARPPGAEGANASARVNVPGSVPSVTALSLASDLLPAVTDKRVPSQHHQLYRAGVRVPVQSLRPATCRAGPRLPGELTRSEHPGEAAGTTCCQSGLRSATPCY